MYLNLNISNNYAGYKRKNKYFKNNIINKVGNGGLICI